MIRINNARKTIHYQVTILAMSSVLSMFLSVLVLCVLFIKVIWFGGGVPLYHNMPHSKGNQAQIQYWVKPKYEDSGSNFGYNMEHPPKFCARLRLGLQELKVSSNQTPSPMQQQPSELSHHHIYARRALCPLAALSRGCQRQVRTHRGATTQGDQYLFSFSIAHLRI